MDGSHVGQLLNGSHYLELVMRVCHIPVSALRLPNENPMDEAAGAGDARIVRHTLQWLDISDGWGFSPIHRPSEVPSIPATNAGLDVSEWTNSVLRRWIFFPANET